MVILLLLILLHYIIYFSLKHRGFRLSGVACGLFGFVGSNPKQFNEDKFNILGIMNDVRGGDSCGIVSKDISVKGAYIESKFKDLILSHGGLLYKGFNDVAIIGHTRKASVGVVSKANAQPINLVNAEDSEDLLFSLAHNGTLVNYDELAEKYGLTERTKSLETDSKVFAFLLRNVGWDILSEYNGAAAIIVRDYENDPEALYVFHGKSNLTPNSTIPAEERPLYGLRGKTYTYVSSIEDSLNLIKKPTQEVFEFKHNVLYRLIGGSVEEIRTIDRSKCFQREPYRSTSSWNNNSGRQYNIPGFNGSRGSNNNRSSSNNNTKSNNAWKSESLNLKQNDSRISYFRGRYWYKKDVISGCQYISEMGHVSGRPKKGYNRYYFIKGCLVVNETGFNRVNAARTANGDKRITKESTFATLLEHAVYPVDIMERDFNNIRVFSKDILATTIPSEETPTGVSHVIKGKLASGNFKPLWTNKRYYVENGKFIRVASEDFNDSKHIILDDKGLPILEQFHELSVDLNEDYVDNNDLQPNKKDFHFDSTIHSTCPTCGGSGMLGYGECYVCEGLGHISIVDKEPPARNTEESEDDNSAWKEMESREVDEIRGKVLDTLVKYSTELDALEHERAGLVNQILTEFKTNLKNLE